MYVGEATGEVNLEHGEPEGGVVEISGYKWLRPEEILELPDAELRYRDIKLLVQKWQQNTAYPLDVIDHIVQT